ncbi:HAD-IIIC family phosphatase [Ruminococcus sp.]|uniref:HAD-IIIC family phosphatase n=1 Tax=Ruminococcus sp. TaxID=41978 RepID=UPI00388D5AD3
MIKCIIWDLDNTVWDGIISESDSVCLNQNIIKVIEEFNKRGVVNSVCSKNDCETAKRKLIEFNIWDMFIFPQINWDTKSFNVNRIVSGLHFKEEDVLFVDDSEFEINEVKSVLTKINTCFPYEYEKFDAFLNGIPIVQTSEVNNRLQMYKDEEKRIDAEELLHVSRVDFLNSCNIKMVVSRAGVDDLERIGELVERSHQINSTGISIEKTKLVKMIDDVDNYDVLIASIHDDYGDYGRAGLLVAHKSENYEIMLFIVSCRLMGKGISQALLAYTINEIMDKKYKKQIFHFKRNQYNRSMVMFMRMNNFSMGTTDDSNLEMLERSDNGGLEVPSWVNITVENIIR